MYYSCLELQQHLNFLRDCEFLGQRASALAQELAPLLEEQIEEYFLLDGMPYYPDLCMYDE